MTDHSARTGALHQAVLGPHTAIEQLTTGARAAEDARDAFEVVDAYMSVVSRHLASVETTMLPVAESRLPDGRRRAAAYLADARSLEQAVRRLQARVCGGAGAQGEQLEQLWRQVDRCLRSHVEIERALVTDLAGRLGTSECAALSEQVHATANNAPSRPHPLPSSGHSRPGRADGVAGGGQLRHSAENHGPRD